MVRVPSESVSQSSTSRTLRQGSTRPFVHFATILLLRFGPPRCSYQQDSVDRDLNSNRNPTPCSSSSHHVSDHSRVFSICKISVFISVSSSPRPVQLEPRTNEQSFLCPKCPPNCLNTFFQPCLFEHYQHHHRRRHYHRYRSIR